MEKKELIGIVAVCIVLALVIALGLASRDSRLEREGRSQLDPGAATVIIEEESEPEETPYF